MVSSIPPRLNASIQARMISTFSSNVTRAVSRATKRPADRYTVACGAPISKPA